jgi:hypothetical protein
VSEINKSKSLMFEILFLAFAIIALLRLPKDVRRMRKRERSASPAVPEHPMCGHAVRRAPGWRPLIREDQLSEIGSLSKWPSLRHANENKRRL